MSFLYWVVWEVYWFSNSGLPSVGQEDYPNDYYNDEEYYADNYDSDNVSNELYDNHQDKETIIKRNPKFLSQSKKITINEGDTIKLPCMVDNLDNLVIIWKKGKNILSVGDNFINPNDKR